MEDLIKMVSEKAGITAEQAKSAVESIVEFLKEKMPAGVGDNVKSFLEGKESGGLAGMAASIKDKLGL